MATLPRATTIRATWAFMLGYLPALGCRFGKHARSSLRPSRFLGRNTKTDQTHGRSVALLTRLHPKCPFQVELLRVRAFLMLLPSTGVLRSSRTIWMPDQTGQYGTFPIPIGIRVVAAPRPTAPGLRSRSERTARPPQHVPRFHDKAAAAIPRLVRPLDPRPELAWLD